MSLLPTVEMMNEMCIVLTDMERNGIKIDLEALDALDIEYSAEKELLEKELNFLAQEAMGDTPINLNSPEQLSTLIYSRKIKDKKRWAEIFNLGTTPHGSGRRAKRPIPYEKKKYNQLVNGLTEVVYKTSTRQCPDCKGKGKVSRKRKDGTYGKLRYNCTVCTGLGILYTNLKEVAGFAMTPKGVYDLSTLGFKTNKEKLEVLATHAKEPARTFLTKMVRYNAVSVYLSAFIGGIKRNVGRDGILHTQFMQCVAATARLSSRAPNFHNQPRGDTFPIRRVVSSRFPGGIITDGDYGQLEFRVAAELSGCKQALEDIKNGVDVHRRTSDILTEGGQSTNRQDAKPHTFKPLYGGTSGTDAEKGYYVAFLKRYSGIADWHETLLHEALTRKNIRLPSGREYSFPFTKRYPSGGVSGGTQIKNYPVQGFATADIVLVATIALYRRFMNEGLRSLLINEVHDSIVVDTHPDEIDIAPLIMKEVMLSVPALLKERYDYDFTTPLSVEIKQGVNWLDMKTVYEGSNYDC